MKCILQYELKQFFSCDRMEEYLKFLMTRDLVYYKDILERMLDFVIHTHPKWISDLLDEIAPKKDGSSQTCIYSIEEISKILLECQRVYYDQWTPTDDVSGVRDFLSKGYMNRHPSYNKQALQSLISLIKKYPDGCIWVILDRTCDPFFPTKSFLKLSFDEALLNSLEDQGFSFDAWLDLIKDPKIRYILNYARSTLRTKFSGHIELLPDEEVDLDNIDYIYRAILAEEERDRQQATSNG